MPESSTVLDYLGPEVFSVKEIKARVQLLAREIEDEFLPDEFTAIPIWTGANVFASDLLKKIRLPVKVLPISAASYTGTKNKNVQIAYPDMSLVTKNVLVIEDIVDSGNTLKTVLDFLDRQRHIEKIRTCALLHKGIAPLDEVMVDFTGFKCPRKFVVGYGMDYNHYFRNLPDIYELKKEF